jgi:hypothetical protein
MKLEIELNEKTFAWLEILASGLAKETLSNEDFKQRMAEMSNDSMENLSVGVADILENVAESLATGVKRKGSWERNCVQSLTGYQGTYIPEMFHDCIKEEAIDYNFNIES